MTDREYRVSWKRDEYSPKHKLYQTERGARRWLLILTSQEYPFGDGEELACCDGRECGCLGATNSESWSERKNALPRLEWARLESRPCGAWEADHD